MADPDFPVDQRWTDWAPWLARFEAGDAPVLDALGDAGGWWWFERIGTTLQCTGARDVARALTAILADLRFGIPDLPLGRLLPRLPLDLRIEELPASTLGSAPAVLRRHRFYRVADIAEKSVVELYGYAGLGAVTMRGTLAAVMEASLSRAGVPGAGGDETLWTGQSVLTDLRTLAVWARVCGRASARLVTVDEEDFAPVAVEAAADRMRALTASDLAPESRRTDPIAQIAGAVAAMPAIDRAAFTHRVLGEDQGADAHAVQRATTRFDRVNAIEARVRKQMRTVLAEPPAAMVVEGVQRLTGQVMALDRALERIPALGREMPNLHTPLWRVLAAVDQGVYVHDGWIGSAPIEQTAKLCTVKIAEVMRERDSVGFTDIADQIPEGLSESEAIAWLAYCGFETSDDRSLVRVATTADRVVRELDQSSAPQPLSEGHEKTGQGSEFPATLEALAEDARVISSGVRSDGPAPWNLKPRRPEVTALIRAMLIAAGGQIPLEDLVTELRSRNAVTADSVRSAASKPPFRLEDGKVKWLRLFT